MDGWMDGLMDGLKQEIQLLGVDYPKYVADIYMQEAVWNSNGL